jgi:hypothetical protein
LKLHRLAELLDDLCSLLVILVGTVVILAILWPAILIRKILHSQEKS